MVKSGKLNLAAVAASLAHWPLLLGMVLLGYAQVATTAWRWRFLLRTQGIGVSFRMSWGLTMIGQLFNVAIPGATGGDLVKGYYITRANPERKSHAATTILMDRVTGLLGLLILGAAMAVMNFSETMRTPATRSLGLVATGGAFAGLAGLYAVLYAGQVISGWAFIPAVLRNVFGALHEYRARAHAVPLAVLAGVMNQSLGCAMYYLALRAAGAGDMRAGVFFLVFPLGMITTALPLAPGGIGVGQAAFFALYQFVAPSYAAAGTSAVTVYQLVVILISISGLGWYVSYRQNEQGDGAN